MPTQRRLFWIFPALVLALTAFWQWGPLSWPTVVSTLGIEGPFQGAVAPDFRLPPLNPTTTSGRLSTYRSQVVLLTFWATWCGPCKREMPELQRLVTQYGKDGFQVLAISIDKEGRAVTDPYADIFGLTFPILHDTDGLVAQQYRIQAVPQNFLISRDGHILWRQAGAIDWTEERQAQLLAVLHGTMPQGS